MVGGESRLGRGRVDPPSNSLTLREEGVRDSHPQPLTTEGPSTKVGTCVVGVGRFGLIRTYNSAVDFCETQVSSAPFCG